MFGIGTTELLILAGVLTIFAGVPLAILIAILVVVLRKKKT